MNANQVKTIIFIAYAVIVVLVCRIVIPLITEVDSNDLLKALRAEAARIFIVIVSVLLLLATLVVLSFCAFSFGNESVLALFSPFFFVAILWTYLLLVESMLPALGSHGIKKFMNAAWIGQLKKNDTLMSQLQTKFKCCGMDGPSDYLLYMEKIHSSCFENNSLVDLTNFFKSGCNEVIGFEFQFVYYMAVALTWLTLAIEFSGFVFSTVPLALRFVMGPSDKSLPKIRVY